MSSIKKDAERYRAFIDCGFPIIFLGGEYRDKESLDRAIDEHIAEVKKSAEDQP